MTAGEGCRRATLPQNRGEPSREGGEEPFPVEQTASGGEKQGPAGGGRGRLPGRKSGECVTF